LLIPSPPSCPSSADCTGNTELSSDSIVLRHLNSRRRRRPAWTFQA
jgi:hypothetical protein